MERYQVKYCVKHMHLPYYSQQIKEKGLIQACTVNQDREQLHPHEAHKERHRLAGKGC